MGAVHSQSGAGRAPQVQLARSATTVSGAVLTTRLAALRSAVRRQAAILRLRSRLLLRDIALRIPVASDRAAAGLDRLALAIRSLSVQAVCVALRAIEWRRVALVASEPFVLPGEFRAAMVRILAYLGAIGAMSLIAAEFVRERHVVEIAEPPARPVWIEVDKPWPAFQVAVPGFGEEDGHYAIRRHPAGGGRKDIISFGELGRTQRFVSFEIYRAGGEIGDFGRAADEVRAMASEYGRVNGLTTAIPIPSKFGMLQTFEFAIGPFNAYHCIGFARSFDAPRAQIGGVSCNMKLLVDRSAISCALDRLTLISAGSDPDIARLFAQAELKRSFCGQRDHLLYATPKRPDMASSVIRKPRLRGRIGR